MGYIFYNPNPRRRNIDDCAIRAVAKLTDQTWDEAYIGLSLQGLKMSAEFGRNYVWGAYLHDRGFVKGVLPDTCPDCYTIKEFCYDHPIGRYALVTDGHVVAVVDGDYYDSWDSGDEVPLFYWKGVY